MLQIPAICFGDSDLTTPITTALSRTGSLRVTVHLFIHLIAPDR
jgi:hypothetical protein